MSVPIPETPPAQLPLDPADGWLTPFRFALILAGLIAAFFPEVIFAGKSFVFRDFGICTYPTAYFQRESFWHGQLPLWNPLNDCGMPFLAQWNSLVLYPLSLIYLLLPLTGGLTFYLLAHLFLAGMGMYFLAAQWTGNRLAAGVAGIAFVFNGMTLNCLMWTGNVAALAWMPWTILLVGRAWRQGGKTMIVAVLVGAMQMLTGGPEIILFTWLLLLALWAWELITEPAIRRALFVRFPVMVLLVGLLSAVQLLPFLDLLTHSERSSALGASFWSIPLWGWANLLVPLFHCYRSPLGVFFQPGQDVTSSYYPGVGTLALAILALIRLRTPRVWLLGLAAILGFVLALGHNGWLYPLLLKIFPPLGFMRYPVKFVLLDTFTLPLLAAFAVARFRNSDSAPRAAALRGTIALATLLSVIIGGVIWYARIHPFPNEQWPIIWQNGLSRIVFLATILGLVHVMRRIQRPRGRMAAGLLLLTLVWLDVVTHAPRQNPTVHPSVYQAGLVTQKLIPPLKYGEGRAWVTRSQHDAVYYRMLPDAYNDYVGNRLAMVGNCNLLDGLPVPGGLYCLNLREQRNIFLKLFLAPTNDFPKGLADFLSISHVSGLGRMFEWEFRPSHLPLATLGAKPLFTALSNTPALLQFPDFDPRQVVYLPPEAQRSLAVTNQTRGTIKPTHSSAQRLEFEVEADAPALLVLSQTFYHPWRAYVNDRPVEIWRANYAFQAVEVPAGRSAVRFVYRDKLFLAGAILWFIRRV